MTRAYGERSPGEQEHGLGPVYLLEVRHRSGEEWLIVTHGGGRLALWRFAGYARAAAAVVRDSPDYADARAVPAWTNFVLSIIGSRTSVSDPRRLRDLALEWPDRRPEVWRQRTNDVAAHIAEGEAEFASVD